MKLKLISLTLVFSLIVAVLLGGGYNAQESSLHETKKSIVIADKFYSGQTACTVEKKVIVSSENINSEAIVPPLVCKKIEKAEVKKILSEDVSEISEFIRNNDFPGFVKFLDSKGVELKINRGFKMADTCIYFFPMSVSIERNGEKINIYALLTLADPTIQDVKKAIEFLSESISFAQKNGSNYFVPSAEIDGVSTQIADNSKMYKKITDDGMNTVYLSVDFQQDDNMKLMNNRVLRETCRKLDDKQQKYVAGDVEKYELMSYEHLVGELKIHLMGYCVTSLFEGDSIIIDYIFDRCKVADLNIDEKRLLNFIDVFGKIYS